MKKILFSLIFLCLANTIYAQKLITTYNNGYFKRDFNIEASETSRGKYDIYIGVMASDVSTAAFLNVENRDLGKLKESLIEVRDKYAEWCDVAVANNITDMTKIMDIKLPTVTVCWKGSKWWFAFGQRLTPYFMIMDDGRMVVIMNASVTASTNKYIDEKIYWAFASVEDFDELLSKLDFDEIKRVLQNDQKTDELFQ